MNGIPWSRLVRIYEKELRSLFHAHQILNREGLIDLATSRQFQEAAYRVAHRMVSGLSTANARSWREAAMQGTRSREIFQALQAEIKGTNTGQAVRRIVQQNAQLIRSVPVSVAQHLAYFAAQEQQKGARASEVEKEIRTRAPRLTASKIRTIARTEISKAETALTRVRSEEIGIDWFQWKTSEDRRVRESHQNLDGVLVQWKDLPDPERLVGEVSSLGRGAPGEFPNCRCVSLPLVSLGEIAWPARVYAAGRIERMARARFQRSFAPQRLIA